MTAHALRDWCRLSRTGSAYIEPGAPWENPYVESFGGRIRDELLSVELFCCLLEARVLIEDWRIDYNHRRPHSALAMMTPATFAASLRQPAAAIHAKAAGEESTQRHRRPSRAGQTTAVSPSAAQRQNAAEETTPTATHGYRDAATTPTQLSKQVDR